MMLGHENALDPVGYLELNAMSGDNTSMWLGHCLVRPDCRGRGVGQMMVDMMLEEAFANRGARDVCLIVFPDNYKAIDCYRRAGFAHLAPQTKFFCTTNQHHQMLCMNITSRQYARRL
jgi:RimJ/RimL family protein N-acetyltransferase